MTGINRLSPETELLPCPFCGEQPRITKRADEDLWTHNIVEWTGVHCTECDVGFDWPPGAEPDAIMQWNTRPLGAAQTPAWHEAAAKWLTDKADLATNSLHCGDSSMTIHFARIHAETLRGLAKEIRILSDTSTGGNTP